MKRPPAKLATRNLTVKKRRSEPVVAVRSGIEQDLALGQLMYDLRTQAALVSESSAARMGTTQSVIPRL